MKQSTTIVSAYYAIDSKFSMATYMKWGGNFMSLESPIVIFTSSDLAPILQKMRGEKPIQIIIEEFEDIHMWKLYNKKWKDIHKYDTYESHTPELYSVWANKCIWVAKAIEINPFKSDYFFWCDFGAFRNLMLDEQIRLYFPLDIYFKSDRILSLLLEEYKGKKIDSIFIEDGIIGGGLWGGGISACLQFRNKYEEMLNKYFLNNIHIGQDQQIMASVFYENPDLVDFVIPYDIGFDKWFFLEYLLSSTSIEYIPWKF